MTEVTVKGKDGYGMLSHEYNGLLFPPIPGLTTKLENLQDFTVRDDDVIICGYPRSGTNWVWEVVTMLLSGKAENAKCAKIEYMLEYRDQVHLNSLISPRVLNTHLGLDHDYIPRGFIKKKCKMLYLVRNPKDVAVSWFNFSKSYLPLKYEGSWSGFFDLWLQGKVWYGSWIECIQQWEKNIQRRDDLDILLLAFEDLKLNFGSCVRQLAQFLGAEHDDWFYEQVEEKCNFQTLKASKDNCYDELEKSYWRGGKPAYMRKGTVGEWKNWFTIAQNEEWDEKIAMELKDSKWTFKYDLNEG